MTYKKIWRWNGRWVVNPKFIQASLKWDKIKEVYKCHHFNFLMKLEALAKKYRYSITKAYLDGVLNIVSINW
jgi:hypothetical protein